MLLVRVGLLVCCAVGVVSLWAQSPAKREEFPSSPRNAKGELQRFDCSFVLEQGGHKHMCDPIDFGKEVRAAKTIAVVGGNFASDKDGAKLCRDAANIVRAWGRFKLVDDTDAADIVLQVNMYSRPFWVNPITRKEETRPEPLPACSIWVWPHGANPDRDNVLWEEMYWPQWHQTDAVTLTTCLQRLHKDIQDAERSLTK